jgi:hypothetical protein
MSNPIEDFLRAHVAMCRAFMDDREPSLSVRAYSRHLDALAARHSEDTMRVIHDRARALVRELFGGEAPPPPVDSRQVAYGVLEADVVAEQLAKEYRRAGVRCSTDPAWRETMNTRAAAWVNRYMKKLEQRAAAPAPTPPTDLTEQIAAEVARALSEQRAAHYVGTWKPGTYERGAMTTHHGGLWHCEHESTTEPPGTSAWKLMHKTHK